MLQGGIVTNEIESVKNFSHHRKLSKIVHQKITSDFKYISGRPSILYPCSENKDEILS